MSDTESCGYFEEVKTAHCTQSRDHEGEHNVDSKLNGLHDMPSADLKACQELITTLRYEADRLQLLLPIFDNVKAFHKNIDGTAAVCAVAYAARATARAVIVNNAATISVARIAASTATCVVEGFHSHLLRTTQKPHSVDLLYEVIQSCGDPKTRKHNTAK